MFEIKNKLLFNKGLYDIKSNFVCLINDGFNDILYLGTNKYGAKILGSILFEDDENFFLRYIHSLISDDELNNFINGNITLKDLVKESDAVFIVDKDYNRNILDSALIPINEVPIEFLPLENSFCPKFVKENTLDYTFSLKGELADIHKAEPIIVSETNTKVFNLLSTATRFLNDLDIHAKIYSEVALAGSFELNFEIELYEPQNLFAVSNYDIKNFIFEFLKYLLNKLPLESTNEIMNYEKYDYNNIKNELKLIYTKRNAFLNEDLTESKLIDLINYSVNTIKDIEYKGFDRIEIKNKLQNGEKLPVALINEDYYKNVLKVLKENKFKDNLIIIDKEPQKYMIQVYSFNRETGNGGAYYVVEKSVIKIELHLRGKKDYHNTIYTKSLDENIQIEILGTGKWINNILKEITVLF